MSSGFAHRPYVTVTPSPNGWDIVTQRSSSGRTDLSFFQLVTQCGPRCKLDYRFGNKDDNAIGKVAGSAGPCCGIQQFVTFKVFALALIFASSLVSSQDRQMGRQVQALC
ncbi:hypothetical protein IC608_06805 [Devosia sp. PTR5]|uniref:Uncharacterized protein n=1 Tax=Devosia oryzisoli TaxID=2774138 RepID=A0A927ISW2_9HYPH|nr:hypothetical protein [Devosia oryzisoli]MBD8065178.1 hypothetical protein [Devosia oryzisoli]